jgi:Chitin binding Peritrophin-A domain
MKFLILCALIGLAAAQQRDPRCPSVDDRSRSVNLPHPTDCGAFLKCHNGNTFEVRCPANQHWNARSNICDSVQNARCFVPAQPLPPWDQPRVQPPPPWDQPRIQPPRPVFPPQQQRPSFPVQRPEIIEHPDFLNCPSVDTPGRVVYFPYHMNCQQFYQCVNGRAVL